VGREIQWVLSGRSINSIGDKKMAIITNGQGRFAFTDQATFNAMAMGSTLIEGYVYFVAEKDPALSPLPGKIYVALSANTYRQMSELRYESTLPAADAATVEKGIIYLEKTTGLLAVSVPDPEGDPGDFVWEYLNNAFVDVVSGTGANVSKVFLVKQDGTQIVIPIPTVDVGVGTNGELVSANAAGVLGRSGKTIAGIMTDVGTAITTAVEELEGDVDEKLDEKANKVSGSVENEIALLDDEGDLKTSGKKFVTTIAKAGDVYSDNEVPTEKAIADFVLLKVAEATAGARFRGLLALNTSTGAITTDVITVSVDTEAIEIGDNWLVTGTPGIPGIFYGVAIGAGDTIKFINRIAVSGTFTSADFEVIPNISIEVINSLDADQAGDAYRALSALMGNQLFLTKLDKLASGAANEIILSTATGIKRSGVSIVSEIAGETLKRYTLDTWIDAPIAADFDGTTGAISDTVVPGTEETPYTATIAGRTVRIWTDETEFFIDIVLQSGDDPSAFTLSDATFTSDDILDIVFNTDGVPNVGAITQYVANQLAIFRSTTDADLSTKMDKTTIGNTGEILTADGSGGAVKSGKTIGGTITVDAVGMPVAGSNAKVPTNEDVAEFVKSNGFRWIVY
jgi:hypothetical protein